MSKLDDDVKRAKEHLKFEAEYTVQSVLDYADENKLDKEWVFEEFQKALKKTMKKAYAEYFGISDTSEE